MTLHVYVGSTEEYAEVEPVMEHAITSRASGPVAVHFMRPGVCGLVEHGCTGFTNFRWAIPGIHADPAGPARTRSDPGGSGRTLAVPGDLNGQDPAGAARTRPDPGGAERFAVYLDVDMFVLADLYEILQFASHGYWSCLLDGSTEVMVVDLEVPVAPVGACHETHKSDWACRAPLRKLIPLEWNEEDRLTPATKLMHFTDIARQPWRGGEHTYGWVYRNEQRRLRDAGRDPQP